MFWADRRGLLHDYIDQRYPSGGYAMEVTATEKKMQPPPTENIHDWLLRLLRDQMELESMLYAFQTFVSLRWV